MAVNIKITGLKEVEKKLNAPILLDPAINEARDTIVARIVDRPGKGMGAKNNTLSATVQPLGARITSTLSAPRQTGSAWQRKNFGIVKAMAPRVIKKAIQRIEARWAS